MDVAVRTMPNSLRPALKRLRMDCGVDLAWKQFSERCRIGGGRSVQRIFLQVLASALNFVALSENSGKVSDGDGGACLLALQIIETRLFCRLARLGCIRAMGQRYADTVCLFEAMGGETPERAMPADQSRSRPPPAAGRGNHRASWIAP